ncbi:MAG TPA: hypothetical protein VN249_13105 [Prolixibacteraceae bacterium]|nr:hypothetical protein [Prolixibacteraceae bacterium]
MQTIKLYLFLLITAAAPSFGFGLPGSGEKPEEPIALSNKREIFVDNYLIDKLEGIQIVKHTPHDESPVLFFDNPWEGVFCGYCTIIQDGERYLVYYRGLPTAGKDGTDEETTCIAVSDDGIHWQKPDLGLFMIKGSLDNNVILANDAPSSHNFSPFLDRNPDRNPDQKYKALAGEGKSGLRAYVSPDGIHWKKLRKEAVLTGYPFDSQNVSFWSESEQCYLCYFRTWTGGGYQGIRSVSRTTSVDFINWTRPVAMSFGDTTPEHLYTQQTSPYFRAPHIYVAIGGRFMPNRMVLTEEQAKKLQVDPGYFKDCSDAYLMTTRGGSIYDRTFMEAFIRPGIGMGNWVSRSNYPVLNVVQTGPEEMSVYVNQDYAQPTAHIRRYSLRLDGFTSLSASYKGGEMISRPFTFSGHELEINYSTSAAGSVRIELQDENGLPIPGFTLNDSQEVIGNEISRIVQWNGQSDLQSLISKVVRLRIQMKDADLFSLRFK